MDLLRKISILMLYWSLFHIVCLEWSHTSKWGR
jgi:hypothetical protein